MSVGRRVNERLAALTAAGHERLARPDPPQPDRRRASSSGSMREDSLRGVTSNPAIFEKAILGSTDYDEQIARAGRARASTRSEIYDADRDHATCSSACDVLRPVWDERRAAPTASSRSRSSPRFAHDTDGTLAQARDYWEARRPPQPDDQDPRHRRGRAGDRGGDRRGHQRQRDAAVRGRVLRDDRRGLHPRHGAPPRGGRAARRALGGELLRLARGHRGRQAPRRRSAARTCAGSRRSPTRAPPTSASRSCSAGERFAALRDAGRAGAAAAVGVDRA